MLLIKVILLYLILIIVPSIEAAASNFELVFENFTCQTRAEMMKMFDCELRKVETSVYTISTDIIFNKMMDRDFFVIFYVELSPINAKKTFPFVDIKMNMCDALVTKFDMPLVQKFVIEIRRTGNIPYQCPFKKNFLYIIHNFTISDSFLIPIMPHVNFVSGMDFYSSDVMFGSMKTYGKLEPKKRKQRKN